MNPSIATEFTPWASLAGGVLIGISAVMVLLFFGRVAGVSGITVSAVPYRRANWIWRLSFVTGLVLAPVVVMVLTGEKIAQTVSGNVPGMIIAGLLVGTGTVLGSGCTSGHGVCGLARLSPRSLVAVLVFMVTALVTVVVSRHVR